MALSKKKKVIIGVVCAAVVAVGLKVALGSGGGEVGAFVSAIPVEEGSMEETLRLKAVLEGTESVEVSSRLHTEVSQIYVKEGDRVESGQLLATLDSSDLSRQIAVSNGDVALIQTQQTQALEDRQVEYDRAKKAYDDTKALFDIGAASQQEVDDAKKVLDAIPSDNGQVVLSKTERQQLSNANQLRSNQSANLADCEIRSSIAGTVTRVYTKIGRFADETEDDKPMFVIENIDKLQMKVYVNEKDIARVSIGQKVDVTADILDGAIVEGVVARISPTGEAKSQGSSERVIPVFVEIEGTDERLIAGITAKATIYIKKADDVLIVPFEAVMEDEAGDTSVYTVTDAGTVHIVPVTCELETDVSIGVKSTELTVGTQVILSPDLSLIEGDKVVLPIPQ